MDTNSLFLFCVSKSLKAVLGGFLRATVPSLEENLTEPLVAASVKIYERIASELLPTPAKSHYTFNLRDLSKASWRESKTEQLEAIQDGRKQNTRNPKMIYD